MESNRLSQNPFFRAKECIALLIRVHNSFSSWYQNREIHEVSIPSRYRIAPAIAERRESRSRVAASCTRPPLPLARNAYANGRVCVRETADGYTSRWFTHRTHTYARIGARTRAVRQPGRQAGTPVTSAAEATRAQPELHARAHMYAYSTIQARCGHICASTGATDHRLKSQDGTTGSLVRRAAGNVTKERRDCTGRDDAPTIPTYCRDET